MIGRETKRKMRRACLVVSALSHRGVCWGRGVRLVDFVMSKSKEGGFLDCILPRISRLHGIIGVELLLFVINCL